MFRGSFEHTVDAKGRVSVPSRFREIIAERYEGKLVLTMDFDKCITVYPLEEWEGFEKKVSALPQTQKEVKEFMRTVFATATECELDKQGRVLIPPVLRADAGISKSVMVVGLIGKMEIWDKAAWDSRKTQSSDKIGDVLSKLGL